MTNPNRSTAGSGRQCRHSSRIAALGLVALSAVTWLLLAAQSNADFVRQIYDGGDFIDPTDTTAWIDLHMSVPEYYFGRSEGQPARGPNPLPGGPWTGSTDVDSFYDLVPVIHSYYLNVLGRNGPNGLGGMGNGGSIPFNAYRILANINFFPSPSRPNYVAYAGTGSIFSATGNAHDYDLIAHEINHIQSRFLRQNADSSFVKLGSSGESGALNEGLADFFGEGFERYVTGTHDWLLTAPNNNNGSEQVIRNLADPVSGGYEGGDVLIPHPDRYFSPYFYTGTDESFKIHVNSTVLTHAAYLAVEGGTFRGHTIAGLGFDKVEQIFERAATVYFESNESYYDAYFDIIQAANDLYGPSDVADLTQALQSVEMNLVPSPEPSTLVLAGTAVVMLLLYGKRRKRAH